MSEVKFNVSISHESQLSQLKFCDCCNVECKCVMCIKIQRTKVNFSTAFLVTTLINLQTLLNFQTYALWT